MTSPAASPSSSADSQPDILLSVTPQAANKVLELMAAVAEDMDALRVEVQPGGCAGFRYGMYFDSQAEGTPEDNVLEVPADTGTLVVLVDPESAVKLAGSTLDFEDGLTGAGFKVENPNTARSCGCQKSFS